MTTKEFMTQQGFEKIIGLQFWYKPIEDGNKISVWNIDDARIAHQLYIEGKIIALEHIQKTMLSSTGGGCDEILPNDIPDYIATLTHDLEELKKGNQNG